ncbi:uncharacterized protein METZ01_LOCUS353466 [marine metagenome]|uniref:Uncharacterized protein n=1 Tax=marine metagenome TaxID=408172 RepID=A0A382RTK7_9ZZZZ
MSPGHNGSGMPGLRLGILLSAELTQLLLIHGIGLSNSLKSLYM